MALSLGLKIARALTQGSLADSATLGWRTQSLWDCRTTGLSVVPYSNGRAGNIRKALAEILVPLDIPVRSVAESSRADRNVRAPMPLGIHAQFANNFDYSSAEKSCWGGFPALHCYRRNCSQLAKELCVFPFSYWPIPIHSDLFRISSFGFRISGSAGLCSSRLCG